MMNLASETTLTPTQVKTADTIYGQANIEDNIFKR